jgi:hypothetical protein
MEWLKRVVIITMLIQRCLVVFLINARIVKMERILTSLQFAPQRDSIDIN